MKLTGYLICGVLLFLSSRVWAQGPDRLSSDSGVLVSGSNHAQGTDQDSKGERRSIIVSDAPQEGNSKENSRSGDKPSNGEVPPDAIVVKSTKAVMAQMTANMKLTPEQIGAIEPIVEDNIAKVRELQLSLQKGTIDGRTMVAQRTQLTRDENQKLSGILNSGQMKVWLQMQNP
jgi:hypothetical protein